MSVTENECSLDYTNSAFFHNLVYSLLFIFPTIFYYQNATICSSDKMHDNVAKPILVASLFCYSKMFASGSRNSSKYRKSLKTYI